MKATMVLLWEPGLQAEEEGKFSAQVSSRERFYYFGTLSLFSSPSLLHQHVQSHLIESPYKPLAYRATNPTLPDAIREPVLKPIKPHLDKTVENED